MTTSNKQVAIGVLVVVLSAWSGPAQGLTLPEARGIVPAATAIREVRDGVWAVEAPAHSTVLSVGETKVANKSGRGIVLATDEGQLKFRQFHPAGKLAPGDNCVGRVGETFDTAAPVIVEGVLLAALDRRQSDRSPAARAERMSDATIGGLVAHPDAPPPPAATSPIKPAGNKAKSGKANGAVSRIPPSSGPPATSPGSISCGPDQFGCIMIAMYDRGIVHPLPLVWSQSSRRFERQLPWRHTRRFGCERAGDRPSECEGGHCGVDVGETVGTPVLAPFTGKVVRVVDGPVSEYDSSGGRRVGIRHHLGGGIYVISYEMHLDQVWVVVGQHVVAGEGIGTLGDTGGRRGRTKSPHLHFSMCVANARGTRCRYYFDPEPFLEDSRAYRPEQLESELSAEHPNHAAVQPAAIGSDANQEAARTIAAN